MNIGLVNSLPVADRLLIAETEASALADLDEDELLALHQRVHRARTKYLGQYRREASARVQRHAARGKARPRNARNLERAEVFEDLLARVSRAVAVKAKQAASELKAERLAAAREAKASAGSAKKSTTAKTAAKKTTASRSARASGVARAGRAPANAKAGDRGLVSPRTTKARATSKASGARRQARKDSR